MQHARDTVRRLTDRSRLLVPVEQVLREVNAFLRGFAGCFRYGNSAEKLTQLGRYAAERLALFLGKRDKRGRQYGWQLLVASPHRMGLITLSGITIAPRPSRPWRATPNAAR